MNADKSRNKNSWKHYYWDIYRNKNRHHTSDIKAIDKAFLEQTILGSIIERFNNYKAIGVPANKIRSKQINNAPTIDFMCKN